MAPLLTLTAAAVASSGVIPYGFAIAGLGVSILSGVILLAIEAGGTPTHYHYHYHSPHRRRV